jgi:hypothetical protein
MPVKQKGVSEKNILKKSNIDMQIEGFPESMRCTFITRANLDVNMGVIELPDGSGVPGGVIEPGEFDIEYQYGLDVTRQLLEKWFMMCKDHEGTGINPTYSRNIIFTFNRLFSGNPGTFNSGSQSGPVIRQAIGCFPRKLDIPDFDLGARDGDAFSKGTATIHYDDVVYL